MLGFSEKKIGFIDISKLRFGIFKGLVNNGGTQTIRYLPPGSMSIKNITEVIPKSLQQCPVYDPESPFSSIMVLFASEKGESPFIKQYLGEKGKIVDLIKNMSAMERYQNISRASSEAVMKNSMRGDKSVLNQVVDNIKLVDEATQKSMPFGMRKKRNFGGGGSIY